MYGGISMGGIARIRKVFVDLLQYSYLEQGIVFNLSLHLSLT